MRIKVLVFFVLCSVFGFSQKKRSTNLGQTTKRELLMNVYPQDTTASAVVLYEHANYYVNEERDYNFTTDFYFRIKILKKAGFERATVKIPFFGQEKLHDLKAVTYNISEKGEVIKNYLLASKKYTKQLSEKWKEVSFTLSNIKVGSVIEYKYSITSEYSTIDDWYFQSDIPKKKSDFTAAILGNWKYNVRIVGFLQLDRDNPSIKRNCVYMPAYGQGSCAIYDYGMDHVPAFKAEDYMLSKKNFLSKVSFELKSYTKPNGRTTRYAKTWKDAEKKIKYKFLDNQSSKKSYFKRNVIPETILNTKDSLEKAKKIYQLIKENFNWNEKYWPSEKVNIKEAYEEKLGNIFDINLSLFNALQASGINSKIVLLATRNKGLPTRLFPVISDFNFLIVKTIIKGKTYFLDASNKNFPFGLIRFEALNGEGRVLDFKNGGYWEPIILSQKTITSRKLLLEFKNESLQGDLTITRSGYSSLNKRNYIINEKEDEILNDFETKYPNLEVDSFDVKNLYNPDKKLIEKYKITFENDFEGNKKVNINPFLFNRVTENPFKLDKRDYPVDFGYPRTSTYIVSLKVPNNYIVKKIPTNKSLRLPNNGGVYRLIVKETGDTIQLYLKISINKKSFSSDEYFYLKEFYNQLIKTQDTFIELEKK